MISRSVDFHDLKISIEAALDDRAHRFFLIGFIDIQIDEERKKNTSLMGIVRKLRNKFLP